MEGIIIVVGDRMTGKGVVGNRAVGKGIVGKRVAVNTNYSERVYSRGEVIGGPTLALLLTLLVF